MTQATKATAQSTPATICPFMNDRMVSISPAPPVLRIFCQQVGKDGANDVTSVYR